MTVARTPTEDDADSEPTARVVGTVASHLEDRIDRSEKHLRDLINNMDRRVEQRFDSMETAVTAAFDAAKEKSQSHNDLIQAMERQAATFATREALEGVGRQIAMQVSALGRLVYIGVGIAVALSFGVPVVVALLAR